MKKIISSLIFLICIIIYHQTSAQSTVANNNNGVPDFLGGNALSAKPLDIGQTNALPINFYTTGGAYPFAVAKQRMTIFDGPGVPFNAGFVGLSPNFGTG